jgi:hypothetical protein
LNNLLRSIEEKCPSKKRTNPFKRLISNFFLSKIPSKKNCVTKEFLKDLGLLIVKNNLPIQFVEKYVAQMFNSPSLSKIQLPFHKAFSQDILLRLVEKTNELYVVHALAKCHYAIASFDV